VVVWRWRRADAPVRVLSEAVPPPATVSGEVDPFAALDALVAELEGTTVRIGGSDELDEGAVVERDLEARQLRPSVEPRLCGTANAPLLLARHCLDGIAVAGSSLLLHLDEAKLPAAPHDQVDLVAGRPHVRADDTPSPQPVPARRPAL